MLFTHKADLINEIFILITEDCIQRELKMRQLYDKKIYTTISLGFHYTLFLMKVNMIYAYFFN